jgi:hypothetical protein
MPRRKSTYNPNGTDTSQKAKNNNGHGKEEEKLPSHRWAECSVCRIQSDSFRPCRATRCSYSLLSDSDTRIAITFFI